MVYVSLNLEVNAKFVGNRCLSCRQEQNFAIQVALEFELSLVC